MIKQSFLNSLRGLKIKTAEKLIRAKKYKVMPVKLGTAISLILRPNTIILWHENEIVKKASLGDSDELE